MGRPPCCEKFGIKKGPWTPEEDIILVSYIQEHGPGNWRLVPSNTGNEYSTLLLISSSVTILSVFHIYATRLLFCLLNEIGEGYVHVYDAVNFAFFQG